MPKFAIRLPDDTVVFLAIDNGLERGYIPRVERIGTDPDLFRLNELILTRQQTEKLACRLLNLLYGPPDHGNERK